jgi:hypothetical protein
MMCIKPGMGTHTSVIPALGRLRQEDLKFETSLGYLARPCLQKSKNKKIQNKKLYIEVLNVNSIVYQQARTL